MSAGLDIISKSLESAVECYKLSSCNSSERKYYKCERVLAIPSMINYRILIKIYVLHLLHMKSGELILASYPGRSHVFNVEWPGYEAKLISFRYRPA